MKSPSETYIANEEASKRKPVELYKIWVGSTYYYYTNGDVAVVFDSQTYTPATISRGSLENNSTLDVSVMRVQFAPIAVPILQYIAINPIDIIWIEISRLFRDQSPLEKSVIFIGQIKSVSFKGVNAEAECVSFEHFLRMPVPVYRYSISCNHKVFDALCGLTAASYQISASVTLDETQTQLTASAFDALADGYFIGGLAQFEGESRVIIAHTGSVITLAYKFNNLESSDTVDVYPGCDGTPTTCRDKFDNITHYFGFPFIPDENPALRVP
ncbi:MAG: DUF2163 domain-containing protein [Patescibacteria group bacterium]|jgi:uncharacterized phage protein (TIGR02218 family)